jgi:hypothetical protein
MDQTETTTSSLWTHHGGPTEEPEPQNSNAAVTHAVSQERERKEKGGRVREGAREGEREREGGREALARAHTHQTLG